MNLSQHFLRHLVAVSIVTSGLLSAGGQESEKPAAPTLKLPPELMQRYGLTAGVPIPVQESSDPVFDLDFPGGTPAALVEVINSELLNEPVNVVIPDELEDVRLPALRVKSVTVATLFEAISAAMTRSERVNLAENPRPFPQQPAYRETTRSYGFRRIGTSKVPIWVFYYDGPREGPPPTTCRFFQLGSYLEKNSIEDITTAIHTGYELLNQSLPEMKFHPETRLLIVVGSEPQFKLIESVLSELAKAPIVAPSNVDPMTGAPLPARTKAPSSKEPAGRS